MLHSLYVVGHKGFFVLLDFLDKLQDKVGTLLFTLGIMPGLPSSMMPKVPKYGVGTALVSKNSFLSLRRP